MLRRVCPAISAENLPELTIQTSVNSSRDELAEVAYNEPW